METFAGVLAFGAVVVFLAFLARKIKDSQNKKPGNGRRPSPPRNVDEIEK